MALAHMNHINYVMYSSAIDIIRFDVFNDRMIM